MNSDKTNDLRRLTRFAKEPFTDPEQLMAQYDEEHYDLEVLRRLGSQGSQGPRCPKCEGTDIHKRYDPDKYACGFSDKSAAKGEHLHYYCRGCSYDWTGPIADPAPRQEAPGPLIELNAAQEEMLKGWAEHDRGTALWGNSEARLINLRTVARMTLKLANGEAK